MPSDSPPASGLTPQPSKGEPSGDLGLIHYYDALYGRQAAQVTLEGGSTLTLERQGLGVHYLLAHLGQEIKQAPLEDRVSILELWLEHGGANPAMLTVADIVSVAGAIKYLNAPRGMLAWELTAPPLRDKEDEKLTDYEGRNLARIVHTLAFFYHWSLADILALPREVALAHAQECVLEDHERKRWEHYLSDIAWQYDKGSHTSKYRPLPDPPWAQTHRPTDEAERVPDHIREKYWPKGVVIDLQDPKNRKRLNKDGNGNKGPSGRDVTE